MNRIRSSIVILAAAVIATAGCDLINGPSELERKVAAEQQIIKAYSAAVPGVDALKTTFLDAWKKANELKDFKAYKEALQTQVVPALGAYVTATAKMPAGAGELARIHKGMVDAVEKARVVFTKYADELTEENLESGYQDVLREMEAVGAARATYLEQLKVHYASFRVDLVQDK